MPDGLAALKEIADKVLWRPIDTAPKDQFILLWCAEDNSRWLAKWQGGEWYGVDEYGLRRVGASGLFVNAWMPIPDPPSKLEI